MTTDPNRYDIDPEALAWARAKVQAEIDRCRKFAESATAAGKPEQADMWRRLADRMQRQFIGGEGCVMGYFDERRPSLVPAAAVSAVPSRADTLTAADRQFLSFALDQAAEEKSLGDGFTDEDHAALAKLRRMAAEEPQQNATQLPFIHIDDDGDQLDIGAVMASTYDGQAPVVYVATEQHQGDQVATVYVRPERVDAVISALRSARQATASLHAEEPQS